MPQNTTERRYDTPSKCANLAELHGYRGGHGDIYLNAIYAHARPLETRVLELEEELRRMREAGKWISVEDRLPEKGLTVLAWDPSCLTHTMRYYPGIEHPWRDADPSDDGSFSTLPNVTHWKELPLPPQEGPNT